MREFRGFTHRRQEKARQRQGSEILLVDRLVTLRLSLKEKVAVEVDRGRRFCDAMSWLRYGGGAHLEPTDIIYIFEAKAPTGGAGVPWTTAIRQLWDQTAHYKYIVTWFCKPRKDALDKLREKGIGLIQFDKNSDNYRQLMPAREMKMAKDAREKAIATIKEHEVKP